MKGVVGHLSMDFSMIGASVWSVAGDSSVESSTDDGSFVVSTVTDEFVDWVSVDGVLVDLAFVVEAYM